VSAEWAAIYITIFGFVGTAVNVWITLRISNSIRGLKIWVMEKFVSKDDMTHYLSPIKQSIQMVGSTRRMAGFDPDHQPPEVSDALG
jgi:hypothetical protein